MAQVIAAVGPAAAQPPIPSWTAGAATRPHSSEAFGFGLRWLLIAASVVLLIVWPPRDLLPMGAVGLVLAHNILSLWIIPRLTTPRRVRASAIASVAMLNVYAAGIAFSYSYVPESPGWLVFYFLPMSAALRFGVRGSVPEAFAVIALDAAARSYAQSHFGLPFEPAALVLRGCVYMGLALFSGVWAEAIARQRRALDRAASEYAGLYSAAAARADRFHALTDIQRRITERLDLRDVCEHVAQAAVQLLSADAVRVWVRDAQTGALESAIERRAADEILATVAEEDARRAAELEEPVATTGAGSFSLCLPLRFEDRVVGVLGVARSGSDALGADQIEVLEALAASSAIAIENTRLFKVWGETQALQQLNALKSEFIGTISHELRTPLTGILGLAELLAAYPTAPPTVQTAAAEIRRSSEVMARQVEDLLTFAQFERGDVELKPERLDLAEELRGIVAGLARQPGGERLEVDAGCAALVDVDPIRLRQVVSNLVANALRYAPAGPIVVRCAAVGGAARVEVEDHGPGVPPDERARIWEKFYRGRAVAGLSGARATGIGLAVVKTLVEAHGGEVGVASGEAGGALFSFTIPLAEVHAEAARGAPLASVP